MSEEVVADEEASHHLEEAIGELTEEVGAVDSRRTDCGESVLQGALDMVR